MEAMDDMNIDDMINNPFKNIDLNRQRKRAEVAKSSFAEKAKNVVPTKIAKSEVSEVESERMERNHPLQERLLTAEKNALISDKRIDTVKRIIEEQNQRIAKLEEELDLLRRHLDPGYVPESAQEKEEEKAEFEMGDEVMGKAADDEPMDLDDIVDSVNGDS